MKRILSIGTALLLAVSLAACGNGAKEDASETAPAEPEAAVSETPVERSTGDERVLVVFFSETGTTKDIAEKIASVTGGDLYEIKAAQEYTEEDRNWHDNESRTTKEQNDPSVRPEISSDPVSLTGYDTVFLGYPIWWGQEPRILDTFVESCDFTDLTVIPFCTSSSSGIGGSGRNLEALAGTGTWLDGQRFSAGTSASDVESWVSSLQD